MPEFTIWGAWLGIPAAKPGMTKAEHDAIPDFATPKLYAGPLDSGSNITALNDITGGLIASMSNGQSQTFTYDGTSVTYASKKDWRVDGKWDYAAPGGSGSADTGSAANFYSFIVKDENDQIAWTSIGVNYTEYSQSGKVDHLEDLMNNPIKKGTYAHTSDYAVDDDEMTY